MQRKNGNHLILLFMQFNTHIPTLPYSLFIESIFHYKNFIPGHSQERVVPNGHMYLIFELDDIPRNTIDNDTLEPLETFEKAWISGQQKHYITISAHADSEMFVVQFKACGAAPFLHTNIHMITNRVLPAVEILGTGVLELRKELLSGESPTKKFQIIDKWLKKQFDETWEPPAPLQKVLEELKDKPVSKLSKAIEKYPKSQKHLIEQFKKYVGLTPKAFQRIIRFNEIFQKIKGNNQVAWAEIAYQCGYSDQSHFIKEFTHFSGFNPQEFIAQKFINNEDNFFPLDSKDQASPN